MNIGIGINELLLLLLLYFAGALNNAKLCKRNIKREVIYAKTIICHL